MVKVMTKQPLVVPRAVSVQLPSAATPDSAGGVTYQELMLDGERVVLEVPDGVTGPDGVIRLLQYVAPDGTIQYMATGDQEGDEMEYADADGGESTADQHQLIQYVDDQRHQGDEQTQTTTQTATEADGMYAAVTDQDVEAVPPDPSQSTDRQRQSPIAAGSVADVVEDEEVDDPEFVNSQEELVLPQVEEHHQQLVGSDLIGSDEVGDCYVCGQSPAVGSAVWMLLEAHAAHSDAPVAELLADALDRELTITSEDVVCAGCLNIANQCDLPGPLQKSAVCYLRNLYELGRGATEMLEHPVVLSGFPLKRGPGRPRLSVEAGDAPALDRLGQLAAGDADRSVSAEQLPSGAMLGVRGTLLSGYKGLPGRVLTTRPGDPQPARLPTTVMEVAAAAAEDHAELDGAEASATDSGDPIKKPRRVACNRNALMAASVHVHHHEPLLILPPESVGRHVPPPRKYVRRKQLRRAGLMYSRYQQPEPVQRQGDGEDAGRPASPPTSSPAEGASETADETDGGEAAKDEKSVNKVKTVAPKKKRNVAKRKSNSDEPAEIDDHPDDCTCAVCAEEADHQSEGACTCSGCTMMERCRVPVEVAELPSGGAGDCERYRCPQCDALLDLSGARFRRHLRICGKASPSAEDVEKAVGAPSDSDGGPVAAAPVRRGRGRPAEPRNCTTCQVRFPSLVSLKKHCAETGHDKRMPCPFCKRLYHPEILKTHKRSHTGAFHCKICNVFFCSKETLLYHMNRHSGARPFKCGDCDKGFRSPSTLFMHHRRNHTQEKPYRCEHCPKRFAARMELEFHTRQHTGVRPFSCQLCDKTYTSRGTLSKHLLTHTQERQYDCHLCGKQFFTRTIYDSHMNMHNNVRPYQCNHCGKTFFSQNKMSRHRKLNCRQARLASTDVDDEMVMTVEVDPECEVRVTSVDEPLAEGSVILAENMPPQRLFSGRRKSSNPYGRLQHPFRLVDGPVQAIRENPHTVQLEEVGDQGGDDVEMLQECPAEQQSEASQEEADQHININIVNTVSV